MKAIPFLVLAYLLFSLADTFENPPSRGLAKPNKDIETYLSSGERGLFVRSPAVATADPETAHWVQDIAHGFRRSDVSVPPRRFSAAPLHGCDLIPPSGQAKVYFVYNEGGAELPLHLLSFHRLPELKGQRHPLKPYIRSGHKRTDMHDRLDDSETEHVDVFITDTARPVYLVLSSHGAKLWSLHLAEGVKLEAVSVIGARPQALAHLPENTPVRFVTAEGSGQGSCIVTPVPPMTRYWRMFERQRDRYNAEFWKKKVASWHAAHGEYHAWLAERLGEPHQVIAVGDADHLLVGPRPAKPVPYRSFKGAHVVFAPAAWPEWGDQKAAANTLFRLVRNSRTR